MLSTPKEKDEKGANVPTGAAVATPVRKPTLEPQRSPDASHAKKSDSEPGVVPSSSETSAVDGQPDQPKKIPKIMAGGLTDRQAGSLGGP